MCFVQGDDRISNLNIHINCNSIIWDYYLTKLLLIKRWSVAESFTIFENHVYSH